jgi:hypothetical protein
MELNTSMYLLPTAIAIILEGINYGYYYKKLMKIQPFEIVKPFDCLFCTHFWVGTIIAAITLNPFLFILNIITSKLYDRIFDITK